MRRNTGGLFAVLLLLCAHARGQTAGAPANGVAGLNELKQQFEASVRDIQRQELEIAKQLQQRYLAGLTALEAALQSAGGQLSAMIVVRGEKARFERSGDIPDSVLSAELPALQKLQNEWRAQMANRPREQARKLVAVSGRYLQALANLQKALAAKNDARGVDEVKAEKDRLLDNSRMREALALLQTAAPATPAKTDARQEPATKENPTHINPNLPNEFNFPPEEARYVRLLIHSSSQGAPGIDELEIFGPGSKANLALVTAGAQAFASSCISGYSIHRIAHLNDGKYGNKYSWIAAQSENEWAQIKLARQTKVSRVVFSRDRYGSEGDRVPVNFEIQLSVDGRNWRAVAGCGAKR